MPTDARKFEGLLRNDFRAFIHKVFTTLCPGQDYEELCRKIGDGVNQAADLISATASIPSLNFIPLTTFGNWF